MVTARNIVSFAMGHVYVRESYKTLRLGFRVLLSLGSKGVREGDGGNGLLATMVPPYRAIAPAEHPPLRHPAI